jgi:hypothetical protein
MMMPMVMTMTMMLVVMPMMMCFAAVMMTVHNDTKLGQMYLLLPDVHQHLLFSMIGIGVLEPRAIHEVIVGYALHLPAQ